MRRCQFLFFLPLPSAIPNNNPSAAYYRLYRSTSEQSSSGSVDCSKGDPEDQVSAMFAGIVRVIMSKRKRTCQQLLIGQTCEDLMQWVSL